MRFLTADDIWKIVALASVTLSFVFGVLIVFRAIKSYGAQKTWSYSTVVVLGVSIIILLIQEIFPALAAHKHFSQIIQLIICIVSAICFAISEYKHRGEDRPSMFEDSSN